VLDQGNADIQKIGKGPTPTVDDGIPVRRPGFRGPLADANDAVNKNIQQVNAAVPRRRARHTPVLRRSTNHR